MATHTRLGFCYYPDDDHYTQRDLDHWLPALLRLSASWVVLHGDPKRAIPEDFVRGLLDAGIRPVVQLQCGVNDAAAGEIAPLIRSYGSWGVRELIVYPKPNLRSSWEPAAWSRPGLVERFVDRLLPIFQQQRSAGMHPVFPPLEPGGDYWDTAFLQSALQSMLRRGNGDLISDMRIATYAWSYGHPLDWGHGGGSAWTTSYPYSQADESQDQRGFRAVDWYAEISQAVVGRTLPMIVIAGGSSGPAELAPEVATGAMRAVLGPQLPDSVIAFNFHLLVADAGASEYAAAWYAGPEQPKPVVSAAERMLNAAKQNRQVTSKHKPLKHYVLMPEAGVPAAAWNSIRELLADGVLGTSAEEAGHASEVTIVGDEAAIPPSIERKLIEGGSRVRRVAPQHPIWQRMRREKVDG